MQIKLTEQGQDRVIKWFNENFNGVIHDYIIIEGAEEDLTNLYHKKGDSHHCLELIIPKGESYTGLDEYLFLNIEEYTKEVIL